MDSSVCLLTLGSSLKLKALPGTVFSWQRVEARSWWRLPVLLKSCQDILFVITTFYNLVAPSQDQHQQMRIYNPFIVRSVLSNRDAGYHLGLSKKTVISK